MFDYQVVIMVALCFLCFNKASFWGAFTLYSAYSVYSVFIIPLPDIYYYSCTATITFIVGLILQRHYFVAAICSYSLVLVNVLGYWLYENMYDPLLYDNIYAIILIIQAASLLPRGLLNGLRRNNQHLMAKFGFFNSCTSFLVTL